MTSNNIDPLALQTAREAWPQVNVDPDAFAAYAAACASEGGKLPAYLADLYLAFGALRGDPHALRALDGNILPQVDSAVRRIDSSSQFVDDVRQTLRIRMLIGSDNEPPRIGTYAGKGPLAGWLSVSATRIALNLKRGSVKTTSTEDVLRDLPASGPDPEVHHLKTLYRAEFADALRFALESLSERERVVLRLHYVDGMKLAHIATLYKVHESTASRWMSAAVSEVGKLSRKRLEERLSVSRDTLDSMARLVQSSLDVSIRRILGGDSQQ